MIGADVLDPADQVFPVALQAGLMIDPVLPRFLRHRQQLVGPGGDGVHLLDRECAADDQITVAPKIRDVFFGQRGASQHFGNLWVVDSQSRNGDEV